MNYLFFALVATVNISVVYRIKKNSGSAYGTTLFYFVMLFSLGNFGTRVIIKILLGLVKMDAIRLKVFYAFNFAFWLWPLAILSMYLMIKFVIQMLDKKLFLRFNVIYFSGWGLYLLTVLILSLPMISAGESSTARGILVYTGDLVGIGIRFYVMTHLVYRARYLEDPVRRRAWQWFGGLWLAGLLTFNLGGDLLNISGPLLVFISMVYILPSLIFLDAYLKKHLREHPNLPDDRDKLARLYAKYNISDREGEVIALVARGKTNREIADELYVSLSTVKLHINSIYRKLKIRNRVQLSNFIRNSAK